MAGKGAASPELRASALRLVNTRQGGQCAFFRGHEGSSTGGYAFEGFAIQAMVSEVEAFRWKACGEKGDPRRRTWLDGGVRTGLLQGRGL